jgi:hypothetical protein
MVVALKEGSWVAPGTKNEMIDNNWLKGKEDHYDKR